MSTDPTLRAAVTAFLKPRLPKTWRFIPNQRTPETITVPTLVLKHLAIKPGAVSGALENDLTLTLLNPNTNDITAENALDEDVLTVCHALRGFSSVTFVDARKIRDEVTKRLGWDINITATTVRKD